MPAPDLRLVRQSVRDRLLDVLTPSFDASQIQWENDTFTPANPRGLYIRETFQVYVEHTPALELWESRGISVFDIFVPSGSGTEVAEDLARKIFEGFEKKHGLMTQGIPVGLDRVERRPGAQVDDDWWMNSINIYWRTYAVATSPLLKTG